MSTKTTDRIDKQTLLRAPHARVGGPFRVGATLRGRITHPGIEASALCNHDLKASRHTSSNACASPTRSLAKISATLGR
jgi:hypothetical protein